MKALAYIISAVFAYFVSGLNPAIIMSKAIYKKDIRTCGSGNPGFTNFKRVFGNKYAWFVFVLDILKCAVISVVAGLLFRAYVGSWALGVAYAGLFAMLGHAFPIYYGFKGGKGFLVCLSTVWFIDWRTGAIATAVLVIMLPLTKYMSLSTMSALVAGAVAVAAFGGGLAVSIMYAVCVLFVIVRHKQNIVRLVQGTESKFSFGKK